MQQPTSGSSEAVPSRVTALLPTATVGPRKRARHHHAEVGGSGRGGRIYRRAAANGGQGTYLSRQRRRRLWPGSLVGLRGGEFGSGLGGQHRRGGEWGWRCFVCVVRAACGGGAPEREAEAAPRRGRL